MGMRQALFAILAFVASGCTIHVVEQPASPVVVAAAPAPVYEARVRPRRVVYVTDPAPVAVVAPASPRTRPPAAPPPRSKVVPFKTLPPEARHNHLAAVAPPARRRPQKVKRPDPPARAPLASIAKAQ